MSDTYQFPARMVSTHGKPPVTITSVEEMDDYRRRGYMPDWHRRHPLGYDYCDAGWRAFYGGRWRDYCSNPGKHVIGSRLDIRAPVLCDEHFAAVYGAGLVTEPALDRDDFYRRYGGPDRPA